MSIAVKADARVTRAIVTEDLITFYLKDGRVVSTPLSWSWRLSDATPAQRENYEIMPMGIHWPDIDEDLSIAGMLKGQRE